MRDPLEILRTVFGYQAFRGLQRPIIDRVIGGGDAIVVMPTGSGKSLCYQIPAIARPGVGIVVSPLIALMNDQVMALRQFGVRAAALHSGRTINDNDETERAMRAGALDLVYLSPERVVGERCLDLLANLPLALLAIDEAHCVSEWGHDFRPEYLELAILAERFPGVPRLALTATADEPTRKDIGERLRFDGAGLFVAGFDRPNIRYGVKPKLNSWRQLRDFMRRHGSEAGIVYCRTRKRTEEFASHLAADGVTALAYHAVMETADRLRTQERFIGEDGVVVCATIAFGMGIDKPDVRFVVHLDAPRSIEAYYQETGRAGRDGLAAETLMLFGMSDIAALGRFIDESEAPEKQKQIERHKLSALMGFAETARCRRQVLLEYFGDRCTPCGNCDTCLEPQDTFDGTIAAQKALSAIYRTGQRFGAAHIINVLCGDKTEKVAQFGHERLKTFGVGAEFDRKQWRAILRQLAALGLMRIDVTGYGALRLTPGSAAVLRQERPVALRRDARDPGARRAARAQSAAETLEIAAGAERTLFEALKSWRLAAAQAQRIPAYAVFHDRTLADLAKARPADIAALRRIAGIGESKLMRYGEQLLEIVARFRAA